MPNKAQPDNFDRLREHLKDDSLAAQLVDAYRNAQVASPQEAMKAVLKARLEKVRGEIANPEA